MKKRKISIHWKGILTILFCAFTFTAFAQTKTVSGTVVDRQNEPLIGVAVRVQGTTIAAATNIDGEFTLNNVPENAVLEFSFVGMVTQKVSVAGKSTINITLEDDTEMLQEVVVTGYGGVQKAKTVTASASTVNVKELARLPVTSMSEGLGGRVTGVITQQSSGAPGENVRIWIRGGSNILYVIDDVVMETAQGNEFFSRLRPDDIASMSILKDASATAVYGPRAANGVVVIATKRGQEGAPVITVNQKVSLMTPSYRAKGLTPYEFAVQRNEVAFANYQESPTFNDTELSRYYMGDLWYKGHSQEDILRLVNERYNMGYTLQDIADLFDPYTAQGINIQDYYSFNDPWDMFDHVQPMYQTNVSIRGGSDRVRYYSSLGYLNQKGVSKNFDYNQVNFVLNTDAFLLKDKSLKFTFNMNGNKTDQKKPAAGEGVFNNAMYGDWMPKRPLEWSTGLPRKGSVTSLLNTGFNNNYAYRFQMNSALKWELPWVEGLAASASLNYTTSYSMNRAFSHDQENVYDAPYSTSFSTYNPLNTQMYQYWGNYSLITGIFQLDYNRSFGKHNLAAMVNYQSQIRRTNWTDARKKGYPTTLAPQINLGAEMVASGGSASEWGSASYIGRLTYDYDNKYLFQYSANYNGSLSYSPEKRWGYFQAVSLGWVVTEESWFENIINPSIMSMFKIRGGVGLVGNEVGYPFSYLTQYAQQDGRVLFGQDMNPNVAWTVKTIANDLKWSSSTQLGLGVDFGFFRDRLSGAFDTYLYLNKGDVMNMTDDMLRTDILGMPNIPQINAPFSTSRKGGFEVSLNWNDKIGKVGYRLGLNYSYWDHRITRHTTKSSDWWSPTWDTLGKRMMHPVYSWGLKTDGLFGDWEDMYNSQLHSTRNRTLGTVRLVDTNGDGRETDYYILNVPGTVPLTQFGVTLGADWNGFDFEVFFQGATHVSGAMPSPMRNQQAYMWNYGQYAFQHAYTPSNPDVNAALPMPAPDGNAWGYSYIDIWAFDASYLKLKNISLRYDLKRSVLKHVQDVQAIDLSFVVTNALTWTKSSYPLKGLQDPEFMVSHHNIYGSGGTLGSYPTQRSYTLSISVTL